MSTNSGPQSQNPEVNANNGLPLASEEFNLPPLFNLENNHQIQLPDRPSRLEALGTKIADNLKHAANTVASKVSQGSSYAWQATGLINSLIYNIITYVLKPIHEAIVTGWGALTLVFILYHIPKDWYTALGHIYAALGEVKFNLLGPLLPKALVTFITVPHIFMTTAGLISLITLSAIAQGHPLGLKRHLPVITSALQGVSLFLIANHLNNAWLWHETFKAVMGLSIGMSVIRAIIFNPALQDLVSAYFKGPTVPVEDEIQVDNPNPNQAPNVNHQPPDVANIVEAPAAPILNQFNQPAVGQNPAAENNQVRSQNPALERRLTL